MAKPTSWDDGKHTTVRRIQISYGSNLVNSIRVEYDSNGRSLWGATHGELEGEQFHEVKLNFPDEFLISITGYNTTRNSENVIKCLIFHSNRRTYGPFGHQTGRQFSIRAPENGKITGFHGKSGNFLNSIEAHFDGYVHVASLGPFGGISGTGWDDGNSYSGIRQIEIDSSSRIHSIRVNYDRNGSSVWSDTRGGAGGTKHTITLDFPREYLVSVIGYYSAISDIVIQWLTFRTNIKEYGPYGQKRGKYFSLSIPNTKIIGFHGRTTGSNLVSLGTHTVRVQDDALFQSVGAFGGQGGKPWDDGKHTAIRTIRVLYDRAIFSITVEYEDNGVFKWTDRRGESGGSNTRTVTLDAPNEYLIAVGGFYGNFNNYLVLTTIRFETNRRILGPFGTGTGKYFTFPAFNGKIVGFFGRAGGQLDSLGAHVKPIPPSHSPFHVEPFGASRGNVWDDGVYTTVRGVEVWCDSVVKSVRFEYDNNGRSKFGERRGTDTTGKLNQVNIDHPVEYIISISGHIITESSPAVQSLTIETNKRRLGPFGSARGTAFSLELTGRKIVGFHGRASNFLEAIGVYTMPLLPPSPYEFRGPSGGPNGSPWDHGSFPGIRTIQLTAAVLVDSFRVEYDVFGRPMWSEKRGLGGSKAADIKLDYPTEYLISVSGFSDKGSGGYIRSLTFVSNKRTYGPFGTETGNPFNYASPNSMIVGFHGRSGNYIDSIGVYFQPIPNPFYPSEFFEPLGGEGGVGWDDGVYDTVQKITVGPGDNGIQHLSFEYGTNRETVVAEEHGVKPIKLWHVEIDDPNEFVISVSGYFDRVVSLNTVFIQSLKFETNKNIYGPYGNEKGTHFSFNDVAGKIVGFHGSSSNYLNKIGVHTKPILD